jgi:hypothetical protein
LTVPAGGTVTVSSTVMIDPALSASVESIVNDNLRVTSAEGPFTTGSPVVTPIADPYAVSVTPATQTDGGKIGTAVSYHLDVTNQGYNPDTYTLTSSGGTYAVSFYASDCVTPMVDTGELAPGASTDACVSVDVTSGAANGDVNEATVIATSAGDISVTGSATVRTIAVAAETLVVDGDANIPDVQTYYTSALTDAGATFSVWDLSVDSNLPSNYLNSFSNVVWFTGNTYPGPMLPYESQLAAFLDGGGRLFLSGQDVLDQAAGQTDFVLNYLHISWDGTETQNDVSTSAVHSVAGSLTDGIGDVPLDTSVLGDAYMDQVTPVSPATGIFTDDAAMTNALAVDSGTYRVVFLGFPFEEYGSSTQKADLIAKTLAFFGA